MTEKQKLADAIVELDEVIARLLNPENGCPWDIKQTPQSITGNVLEETYELIEALRDNNPDDIREECGDVLFQTVFIGRLAQSRWNFGLTEIIEQVKAKMVFRHPHVFGDGQQLHDAQAVLDQWQAIKRKDKKHQRLLASVPNALPALQRAHRLGDRAARAGFDWENISEIRDKISEELAELDKLMTPEYDKKTASDEQKKCLKHELGDVLLAVANMARHLGFSAEEALCEANKRFVNRFEYIEDSLGQEQLKPEDVSPQRLDDLWQKAKQELR